MKRERIQIVPESSKQTAGVTDLTGVGAVILAAGASTRMSIPKQLLQFRGQTLLTRAASVALEAGYRPVVVVTGANAAACRESLRGLDVLEAENQQWESGMSSSIRVGIEALVTPNPRNAPTCKRFVSEIVSPPVLPPDDFRRVHSVPKSQG